MEHEGLDTLVWRRRSYDLLPTGVQVVHVPQRVDELVAQTLDQSGGVDTGTVDGYELMPQISAPLGHCLHEAAAQITTPQLRINAQCMNMHAAGYTEATAHMISLRSSTFPIDSKVFRFKILLFIKRKNQLSS